MTQEAMKLALKALKKCRYRSLADEIVDPAITAINEALAQPKQKPVAIPDDVLKIAKAMQKDGYHGPLSWAQLESLVRLVSTATPPPPQRKPLTDKQILADETLRYYFGQNGGAGPVSKQGRRVVDAIEAAHGIKEQP